MDELAEDYRIISAARMAEAFHCDPVQLLDSTQEEWLIRIAAGKALAADQERRSKNRPHVQVIDPGYR